MLTCKSFDSASLEKSGWRISTIIFELIVFNDFMISNWVPSDSYADVGSHFEAAVMVIFGLEMRNFGVFEPKFVHKTARPATLFSCHSQSQATASLGLSSYLQSK